MSDAPPPRSDTPAGGLRLGVDLGGTKIEAAIVDASGDEIAFVRRERVPTESAKGYEHVVATTAALVRSVAAAEGLDVATAPIGVGMPGSVSRRTGLVKNSNTACLNGRPFRADLERALGRSIAFENDANCFALAEARFGAAKAVGRDGIVFGVIMGTGVGGGVVAHGRVHGGPQGVAGEWGHHAVWAGRPDARACYCGQRGCLEAYASGPAVERAYLERTGERRSLRDIAELAARAKASGGAIPSPAEAAARAAIDELCDAFGRGLANVIDILDPDAIVLGGGVSNLDVLYDEGRARVAHYVFNDELTTPISKHALGDSSGVVGAALLDLAGPRSAG